MEKWFPDSPDEISLKFNKLCIYLISRDIIGAPMGIFTPKPNVAEISIDLNKLLTSSVDRQQYSLQLNSSDIQNLARLKKIFVYLEN